MPQLATVDLAGATVTEVRPPRQAHAHPLRRRPDAAHALPDGRQLAHLPEGQSVEGRRPRTASGRSWRPTSGSASATGCTTCASCPTSAEAELVGHLGPDVLGPDWDLDEALRRLRAHPDEQIGVAILDQRNLAGIGNLYKVETLFMTGIHPWTRVADVPDLPALVTRARR